MNNGCQEINPKTGSKCIYNTPCYSERQHFGEDFSHWNTGIRECTCNGFGYDQGEEVASTSTYMNLIDKAKQIKNEKELALLKEIEEKNFMHKKYESIVIDLKQKLLNILEELDGRSNAHGKFRLEIKDDFQVFAFLWSDQKPVAWFKVGIENGFFDGSDDCRDISYTEARIRARFYPPRPNRQDHDGTWDLGETRCYGNGGVIYSCNDFEKFPKFFNDMSEELARWL